MGRTSKLFPLSGRKSSASETNISSVRDNQPRLSKAERLLGTTGLQHTPRPFLTARPSYKSMNPSISEVAEDHDDLDDFSSPDHFGLDPLPLRLANLQHGTGGNAANRPEHSKFYRSANSSHTRHIKPSWSSTTLKSHYANTKQPLSIPQQTSSSTVRDRPHGRDVAPVVGSGDHGSRRPRTASASSTAYSQEDMNRTTALPDITRLYPKPNFAKPTTLSLSRNNSKLSRHSDASHSTAHSNTPSLRFPGAAPQSRPNTSTGSTRKVADRAANGLKNRFSVEAFPSTMKLFSRRQPMHSENDANRTIEAHKPASSTSKNWFDGLLEEEDESDVESEHDLNLATPTAHLFSTGIRRTPSPRPPDLQLNSGKKLDTVYTIKRIGSAHEITSSKSSATLRSPRTPRTPLSSRGSRKSNRLAVADLADTSVLSTSSSESGSDNEVESEIDMESNDDLPCVRDSITVSDMEHIHIGKAEAFHVQPIRRPSQPDLEERRPSIASITSNPTTADSSSIKSSTTGPAYLSVPNRNSTRPRKSGHTRQPSSIPEDSDTSSQVASTTTPPASVREFSAPPGDNRKLMAVTEEEEALLELMRRKRADKAAMRDSGVKSSDTSVASTSARSYRPSSNLSTSSSILDSFPLSRSQRSSLMSSRVTGTQSPAENSSASKERAESSTRNRDLKRVSNATTTTTASYRSIDSHLESPMRMKYAFTGHLSLTSLAGGMPLPPLEDPSLPSPEILDSPMTPLTRRGSVDVLIRPINSQRNSSASYSFGDTAMATSDLLQEKLNQPGELMRRRTTSNVTPQTSPSLEEFTKAKPNRKKMEPTPPTSDGEGSSNTSTEDLSSRSKRASVVSATTSECGPSCAHFSHGDSKGYNRSSIGYGAGVGTRCSVSEDVLAAWGSLGGWREQPGIMG